DRGIEHAARARGRFTAEHVKARGIAAQPRHHIVEGPEVLVGGELPERARRPRIDPAAEPPEGGIGVDRHDVVLPAEFGEQRADAGGHRRLPHTALAQHADLAVAVQAGLDGRFELRLLPWGGRRAQVDQAKGGDPQDASPTPVGYFVGRRRRGRRRPALGRRGRPGRRTSGRRSRRPRGALGPVRRGTRRVRRGSRRVRRRGARPLGPQTVPQEFVALVHGLLGCRASIVAPVARPRLASYVISATVQRATPGVTNTGSSISSRRRCRNLQTRPGSPRGPRGATSGALSTLIPAPNSAAPGPGGVDSKPDVVGFPGPWPPAGGAAVREVTGPSSGAATSPISGDSEIYDPAGRRLDLTKLACQAGIVISFYDLSRPVPGHRSELHGNPYRIISARGHSPSRQGRRGFSPQPSGATSSGPPPRSRRTFT